MVPRGPDDDACAPAPRGLVTSTIDPSAVGTQVAFEANGGSVIREPIDHPYGRMSTVADDQGAVFSLLGVTAG